MIGWPILDRISLGPVAISPHGVGIAVGYLLGSWWMLRQGPKRGLKEEHIGTIVLWALVGAIVGARGFFVLGHFDEFDGITDMLAVWRGGISLVGGILGAIMFAYPFMRKFGYRFGQVMDSAAVGLAFGIVIGRIGDLVIGDHLGKPTDFALGWQYRSGDLPGPWRPTGLPGEWTANLAGGKVQILSEQGATLCDGPCSNATIIQQGAGIHQTALYDLFIVGGLFLFLWWLSQRPRRDGVLIATFAIWYGAGRILTDFLRIDKTWVIGLTGSQWAAVGAAALGIGTLLWFALRPRRAAPTPTVAEPVTAEGPPVPTTRFPPPPEPSGGAATPPDRSD